MSIVNYTLLREKFTIRPHAENRRPFAALSNRISLSLVNDNGMIEEHYIVRAHNMHLCVRMAEKMLHDFHDTGPLGVRGRQYWKDIWSKTLTPYDKAYNPDRWIAVYEDGQILFQGGAHHAFLDVIEKCDLHENDEYKNAITLAERAFQAAGQDVDIEYESNIAMLLDIEDMSARCSMVIRSATHTKTFAIFLQNPAAPALNHAHILAAAGAYLEGVELCFLIGMNNMKMEMGIIASPSDEERQTHMAARRLNELQALIDSVENGFDVRHRPEKPRFKDIVASTEIIAKHSLRAFHGEFE